MPDNRPVPDPSVPGPDAAGDPRTAERLLTKILCELEPYTPPTEAELQDLLHGPRGESFAAVLDEYDRRHGG